MMNSSIEWTDATWNIARGCTKVNDDCKFCYMMRDGDRRKYDGSKVTKTKTVFNMPLKYKETQSMVRPGCPLIFTSSLTDFFHEDCDEFRKEAWDIIKKCPHLTFQILTKRPERIEECLPDDWEYGYPNVWLGVSAGNQKNANDIISNFLGIPAAKRFLSLEPLTGPIFIPDSIGGFNPDNLPAKRFSFIKHHTIDWVIVGGESGNNNGKWKYRPCSLDWIYSIVDQCKTHQVPVFVKQLGTHIATEFDMKDRHGKDINEFPKGLKIREFPT